MPDNGHNASHYFYVSPVGKAEWTKNLHVKDNLYLLGFDPFTDGSQTINGKTYFDHLNIPFAVGFRITTQYPGLLIGSGYSHPAINEGDDSDYQLGFFFDHTLGVPIIPGSTVKGVLKNVFPKEEKDKRKREAKRLYIIRLAKLDTKTSKKITNDMLEEIFFKNDNVFFHAFPIKREKDTECKNEYELAENHYNMIKEKFMGNGQPLENQIIGLRKKQNKTEIEIKQLKDLEKKFSPIKKKYDNDTEVYKEDLEKYKISQRIIVDDAITPHHPGDEDAIFKEPTPLKFIKIPAGVTFKFQFRINNYDKNGIQLSSKAILNVFKQILIKFGIGAKRNVGYGHFKE